jgi:hypothetical protein
VLLVGGDAGDAPPSAVRGLVNGMAVSIDNWTLQLYNWNTGEQWQVLDNGFRTGNACTPDKNGEWVHSLLAFTGSSYFGSRELGPLAKQGILVHAQYLL